ncbi:MULTISPECIES: hypothetical protein [Vogesella]|uniref:Uncharacterized protein n=1 Tax=Vogesella indigofera TaxID=45465 RepID=A0ABT5I4R3_VOGIN|nr:MULTISPECIES: hypothetical protein [Vogesella]MCQ4144801.1 hypothetical protein [Vogesella sp. AC12]MDC7691073.1 hypothetical protein [Vogesella indigofera]MDC7696741.1 hypothetical protein [Vogesella indigofera]
MRYRSTLLLALLAPLLAQAGEPSPVDNAVDAKIKTCMAPLKKVASFIVKDGGHASHDIWNDKDADRRPFSSLIAKKYSDGDSHVSMSVGPDKSGRCSAEYNETAYWPKACTVLREEIYGEFKYHASLNESTTILRNDDKSVYVYLTPQMQGNGCLSTRREVIYY